MTAITIRPLEYSPETLDALNRLLVETVAQGGSVGFMHPLALSEASAFWQGALESAARSERIILGALKGDELIATVTVLLALPPNQPHRAEIAKMMTHPDHRGRGVASALLHEAENLARAHGRSVLVLDTAAEDGAAGLYERHGFIRVGEIPDYALKPRGGLTATLLYFKRLPSVAG